MNIDMNQLRNIIVSAAKEELMPRLARVKRGIKADGSFVTEADLAVQNRIASQLKEHWPEIGFLGEEMSSDEQRALLQTGQPLWCLDPLDGTSNFAAGIPYFAISLALLKDGGVELGIVYDPLRDECFHARKGEGAYVNDERLEAHPSGVTLAQSSALIDFKRLPTELSVRIVSEKPYSSQRSFGGVALDWCWLASGRCHIYLHGKQNIWDYAAGHLVFHETGGHSIDLSGEPLFVNDLVPRAAVGALDRQLFDAWVDWLKIPRS